MLKKFDKIEVTIEKIVQGGEGLAYCDGMVIFVPQVLPGEKVEVQLISVKKDYARGLVTQILEKSAGRVDSKYCENFTECGGCDLIFAEYDEQVKIKNNILIQEIARAKIETEYKEFIKSENPFNYRNKVIQPFQFRNGEIISGFYKPKSHEVVEISQCATQPKAFDEVIEAIKGLCKVCHVTIYDEKARRGILRNVMLRANKEGEILVGLIVSKVTPGIEALGEEISKISTVVSVYAIKNMREDNVLLTTDIVHLKGNKVLYEKLFDSIFQISPLSFFQINMFQIEKLYERVFELVGDISQKVVLDAYSGTGTMAMIMAKRSKRVVGIEVVESAVKDARQMAKRNGFANTEFHEGEVEVVLPKLIKNGLKLDVAVIDPPRKGIEKSVIELFAQCAVKEVVYVSCNPATLIRDIKLFESFGYKCVSFQGVDMFPHTSHIECVVKLVRG
ncbi:MAG: 23S rRNA (uracil(1939)-C(5))-methyltransferase RlmD [Fusobacteria bacterium]|nr:23S rRNA (uracil(1939)-C(5))-methyltransferase RlmD [Fusobacteriota bacterium]